MDPKSIGATAIVAIVAAVGGGVVGGKITSKATTELTVEVGADEWTKTVATAAQVKADVAAIPCERQRVGAPGGIVLKWVCNGGALGEKEQTEIDKKASADVVSFMLRPKRDGDRVVYDVADVQGGVLPNLDPVPESAPAEKPVEGTPIEGKQAIESEIP